MARDLNAVVKEACRVLDSHGHLCIFTADPDQVRGYWLRNYFPEMIEQSAKQMPSSQILAQLLQASGFTDITAAPYYVPRHPVDLFLYAGKHQPVLYLDADVRAGISSFATADPDEVRTGLARLARDLSQSEGPWIEAMGSATTGDYIFVSATKSH